MPAPKKPKPRPLKLIHAEDNEGPYVRVELSNPRGIFATVDAAAYATLAARGLTSWFLNRATVGGASYVRAYDPTARGKTILIARAITAPPIGLAVSYRDGDRLNLRCSNLDQSVHHGWATGPNSRTAIAAATTIAA